MNKNKYAALGAAGLATLLIFSPLSHAGNKHKFGGGHNNHAASTRFIDYAKVTHVEPIFRRVQHLQQSQHCWYEEQEHTTHYNNHRGNRHDRRQQHPAQTIVGGIVGGAIGNQLGRQSGRRDVRIGATVAGAIVGSAIASEGYSRHNSRHRRPHRGHTVTESRPVKRCEPNYEKHYKRKIVGYDVTYRYRGHTHTTRMQRDPGRRLLINVRISPQG